MTDSTSMRGARGTDPAEVAGGSLSADSATGTTAGATADSTSVAASGYTVVADVNIRSGPGTQYPKVGFATAGTRVGIICQAVGETVGGPLGTSNLWDRISSGHYVSDAFVNTGSDTFVAPQC